MNPRPFRNRAVLPTLLFTSSPALAQLPPLLAPFPSLFPQTNAQFGATLCAGDVNGDGYADVIVAQPLADVGGVVDAGRVHVYLGPGLTSVLSLTQPTPQPADFGVSVRAGDVNGDGFADVVVGAWGANVGGLAAAGRAFVFLGPGLATVLPLTAPTPEQYGVFGVAVATGDVDGDGFDEVVVGSSTASASGVPFAGAAFVFLGPGLTTSLPLTQPVPEQDSWFGRTLATGDVDADGFDEVVVGALRADAGGFLGFDAGEAFVYFGPALTTVAGLTETTPQSGAWFGAVCTGDVDGDGFDDVVGGAGFADVGGLADAGRVSVFPGPGLTPVLSLTQPTPEAGELFTTFSTGDVNGDGFDDVIAGALRADVGAVADAGEAFVFLGPGLTSSFALTQPVPQVNAGFHPGVSTGDVNGDGLSDVVAGAPGWDPLGIPTAGEGVAMVFVTQVDLGLNSLSLSASAGGTVALSLDAGAANAGRPFLVVGSGTGSSPCTPFGPVCVPIVIDPVTLHLLEPSLLPFFSGALDVLGRATLSAPVGPGVFPPSAVGLRLTLAYPLFLPVDYASKPVVLEVGP